MRERCPYCGGVYQFPITPYTETFYVHFCEEKDYYVGWTETGLICTIPDEYVFDNPPGR